MEMAPVKVYGLPMAGNVARVLVCLEEVGMEYEVVPVNLQIGEHKSPAHLARNPFGQVPAFQDGDLILFESRAISKYVLRKGSSALLRERSLSDSAMVDAWLDVESQKFDSVMLPIIFQGLVVPVYMGGTSDLKVLEENLEKLKKIMEVYEERLSKFQYLAGDFISLADISHFPMVHLLQATPYALVLDAYPHVKAWMTGVMARPAVQKVMGLMKTSS